ncbi:MAG: lytic transglycosylase domain-containing protein [Desulfobaccales bacterium]
MRIWFYTVIASLILLVNCGGGRLVQDNLRQGPSLSANDAAMTEGYDVPIQENKQVQAYLVYFSTQRKDVIRRQLAHSTHYLPMIKEVFREYGLPEDLAYLAMIESGFNPEAQSPAGARGLWQFMKGTGVRYGLVINGHVDERRDPVKSTHAAARYLRDLYRQFGSWYLAAASYNCGEKRVQKELNKGNGQNFWELSAGKCLPTETENYVPQMIAATIIAKNPEKFGFKGVPYQQPDSNLAVAALADERVAGGKENQGAALGAVPSPTVRPAAYSPGKSQTGYATAPDTRKPTPTSENQMKLAKKPTPPGIDAANANSTPYAASIFGTMGSPKKDAARENKSNMQRMTKKREKNDKKVANRKSKKRDQTLLAMKREPRRGKVKTVKRNSSPGSSNTARIAGAKPKPLLVSEAR